MILSHLPLLRRQWNGRGWLHKTISGRDGYAAFYKKNFNLIALDPVGAAVEKWEIRGAFITDATFGDYDMASGEVMNIDLTIRMDECILRY